MIDALADSSFIYTVFDRTDKHHDAVMRILRQPDQRVCLPVVTLPEVVFVVRRNFGPHIIPRVLRTLVSSRMVWLESAPEDFARAADIIDAYPEAELDLVDAVIAALAERLAITRILTLDRRDFGIIRPKHCEAFEILP